MLNQSRQAGRQGAALLPPGTPGFSELWNSMWRTTLRTRPSSSCSAVQWGGGWVRWREMSAVGDWQEAFLGGTGMTGAEPHAVEERQVTHWGQTAAAGSCCRALWAAQACCSGRRSGPRLIQACELGCRSLEWKSCRGRAHLAGHVGRELGPDHLSVPRVSLHLQQP